MFVSSGQFFVFLACISYGLVGGLIFFVFGFFKAFLTSKIVHNVLDFISSILMSVLYVFYSNLLNFPNFRFYMPIGVLLGLFMYFKSFNIILAKLQKKIYNNYIKHKGNKRDGRAKVQKSA